MFNKSSGLKLIILVLNNSKFKQNVLNKQTIFYKSFEIALINK